MLEQPRLRVCGEAHVVLDAWREDYNAVRPHSALQDRTPREMGVMWVDSCDTRESTAINKTGIKPETTGVQSRFSRSGFPGQVINGGPHSMASRISGGRSQDRRQRSDECTIRALIRRQHLPRD